MKNIKSILIAFVVLLPIFLIIKYIANKDEDSLTKNQAKTVGITYDWNIFGSGGTLHYFFKTPNGIYKGSTIRSHIKCPGYYYVVIYSSEDPTINKLIEDSLVADSIGKKYIKWEEIDPENFVNKKDYP